AAAHGGEDVGPGSLFATGLVAGGTLTGTVVAFLHWPDQPGKGSWLDPVDFTGRLTGALGDGGYQILGVVCFVIMGIVLYAVARKPLEPG
ncbi:MAG: peptide transporter, partial [Myxococcales bacterium]